MTNNRRLSLALLALLCVPLAACKSQWYLENEEPEKITTNVTVRTTPPGAMVNLNGVDQMTAPVMIPIEYFHNEQLWARRQSVGRNMLETWSWPAKIIGAPVWLVTMPFHYRDEVRRHEYGSNVHVFSARASGHRELVREVKLEGQDALDLNLDLEPR